MRYDCFRALFVAPGIQTNLALPEYAVFTINVFAQRSSTGIHKSSNDRPPDLPRSSSQDSCVHSSLGKGRVNEFSHPMDPDLHCWEARLLMSAAFPLKENQGGESPKSRQEFEDLRLLMERILECWKGTSLPRDLATILVDKCESGISPNWIASQAKVTLDSQEIEQLVGRVADHQEMVEKLGRVATSSNKTIARIAVRKWPAIDYYPFIRIFNRTLGNNWEYELGLEKKAARHDCSARTSFMEIAELERSGNPDGRELPCVPDLPGAHPGLPNNLSGTREDYLKWINASEGLSDLAADEPCHRGLPFVPPATLPPLTTWKAEQPSTGRDGDPDSSQDSEAGNPLQTFLPDCDITLIGLPLSGKKTLARYLLAQSLGADILKSRRTPIILNFYTLTAQFEGRIDRYLKTTLPVFADLLQAAIWEGDAVIVIDDFETDPGLLPCFRQFTNSLAGRNTIICGTTHHQEQPVRPERKTFSYYLPTLDLCQVRYHHFQSFFPHANDETQFRCLLQRHPLIHSIVSIPGFLIALVKAAKSYTSPACATPLLGQIIRDFVYTLYDAPLAGPSHPTGTRPVPRGDLIKSLTFAGFESKRTDAEHFDRETLLKWISTDTVPSAGITLQPAEKIIAEALRHNLLIPTSQSAFAFPYIFVQDYLASLHLSQADRWKSEVTQGMAHDTHWERTLCILSSMLEDSTEFTNCIWNPTVDEMEIDDIFISRFFLAAKCAGYAQSVSTTTLQQIWSRLTLLVAGPGDYTTKRVFDVAQSVDRPSPTLIRFLHELIYSNRDDREADHDLLLYTFFLFACINTDEAARAAISLDHLSEDHFSSAVFSLARFVHPAGLRLLCEEARQCRDPRRLNFIIYEIVSIQGEKAEEFLKSTLEHLIVEPALFEMAIQYVQSNDRRLAGRLLRAITQRNPDKEWIQELTRRLQDDESGELLGKSFAQGTPKKTKGKTRRANTPGRQLEENRQSGSGISPSHTEHEVSEDGHWTMDAIVDAIQSTSKRGKRALLAQLSGSRTAMDGLFQLAQDPSQAGEAISLLMQAQTDDERIGVLKRIYESSTGPIPPELAASTDAKSLVGIRPLLDHAKMSRDEAIITYTVNKLGSILKAAGYKPSGDDELRNDLAESLLDLSQTTADTETIYNALSLIAKLNCPRTLPCLSIAACCNHEKVRVLAKQVLMRHDTDHKERHALDLTHSKNVLALRAALRMLFEMGSPHAETEALNILSAEESVDSIVVNSLLGLLGEYGSESAMDALQRLDESRELFRDYEAEVSRCLARLGIRHRRELPALRLPTFHHPGGIRFSHRWHLEDEEMHGWIRSERVVVLGNGTCRDAHEFICPISFTPK